MTEPSDRDAQSEGTRQLDVLVVTQPVDGGVAACVHQLVDAAVAARHHVTVVSPARSNAPFAVETVRSGARHVTMLTDERTPQRGDAPAVFELRRLMREFDVVHLHSSKAGAVGRLAAASLGRKRPPVVFTPHAWSWMVGGRAAMLYRFVEQVLARACDVIVAVSASEAAEAGRVLERSSHKMIVIENGVDRERYSPDGPEAPRDAAPLIVCVGRLTRQKGQDVALRAVATMTTEDVRIRFVGDGDNQELMTLARALGIVDRVEWFGPVADAAPHYRAADVFVAPSRWEGMSLVLLEAMACGTAVVASRVQGTEAVGDAGVLVPPDDHEALARALDALFDDPPRRADLGVKARIRSEKYDIGRTMARNLELWERLAVDDRRFRNRSSAPV